MARTTTLSERAARLLAAGLTTIGALTATVLTLRFLVPSRVADRNPLVAAGVVILAFAAVGAYWWRQLAGSNRQPPAEVSVARGAVALLVLAALVLGIRWRLVEIARVTGPSMEPTLNPGDLVVVNELAYGLRLPFSAGALRARPPDRGDLIVFPNPDRHRSADEPSSVVKRVIGLPGDEVAFADGSPVINSWIVPSCDVGSFLIADGTRLVRARLAMEVLADRAYLTLRTPLDEQRSPRFRVPRGGLFVLGDDRPVSRDSRAWAGDGGVRISSVEGRVSRLAAPIGSDGRIDLGRLLRGLRPELRALTVDATGLEKGIADCVAHRPRSTWPPPPSAAPPIASGP